MSRRYWHELNDEEYASLMSKEPSIEDIMDNYEQPTWCEMPEALNPLYGCEELTGVDSRYDVSPRNCSWCQFCRKPKMGMFGL
jgi:hypothetical protein